MQNLVNKIAHYSHFSTLDLKSAYHHVEIPIEDRPYTAFEANGKLYQSKRISFGLTNAVPWFQRIIDVKKHSHTSITSLFLAKPKKNTMQIFSNFLKQQRNIILHLIRINVLIRPIVFRYWGTKSMIVHCTQILSV